MRGPLYVRLSDTRGEPDGIERQIREGLAHAERLGVEVTEHLVDSDLSAAKKRRRPAFERLMEGIVTDEWDVVILRSLDRWVRRPAELERIIEAVEKSKVRVEAIHGEIDLRTRQGRLSARLLTAVAMAEVEATIERVTDWHADRATQGLPAGRPVFGYRRLDRQMVVHPEEAALVQEAARRLLEGQSLTSVAAKIGKGPTSLRQIVTSPTVAGLRVHQGQVVGEAQWEPILDRVTWERLRRLFADPSRRWKPGATHLLTGFAACWKCDNGLNGNPTDYYCRHCGAVKVRATDLEAHVEKRLFAHVDLDHAPEPEVDTDAIAAQILALEADISAVLDAVGEGDLTLLEAKRVRQGMDRRLVDLRSQLAPPSKREWSKRGDELVRAWDGLAVEQKRRVIGQWVEKVKVGPGTPGAFDPARVVVEWR